MPIRYRFVYKWRRSVVASSLQKYPLIAVVVTYVSFLHILYHLGDIAVRLFNVLECRNAATVFMFEK